MSLTSGFRSFGRHESFPIRFGWITKGLESIRYDPKVFSRADATISLGVGKNMVQSIRYWLQAARLVHPSQKGNDLTPTWIGDMVFGENGDPYLEDNGSIWLLHWLLASNPSAATAIYWFFNHYHKSTFKTTQLASSLTDFTHRELTPRISKTTLKKDAQLVTRMYSHPVTDTRLTLEDVIDSPLSTLGLLQRVDRSTFQTNSSDRTDLPLHVFAFAVAEVFENANVKQISISDLMYSDTNHCAPGAVFRLTESALVDKLEALSSEYADSLQLSKTAGVFQIFKIAKFDSSNVLKAQYNTKLSKIP